MEPPWDGTAVRSYVISKPQPGATSEFVTAACVSPVGARTAVPGYPGCQPREQIGGRLWELSFFSFLCPQAPDVKTRPTGHRSPLASRWSYG